MPTGFIATQLSVDEVPGALVTAFGASSAEGGSFYLMLQQADHPTEQEVRLGMNQPYIEYCDQGWSWYGHIDRFELLRDRVQVQMNGIAASRMGNDGLIEVEFSLGDSEFERLRTALKKTFHDQAYFVERI